MQRLEMGSARTGKIVAKFNTFDYKQSLYNKTIQGDGTGDIIIPLSEIPLQFRANIGGYLKKNFRFFNVVDDSRTGNKIEFSGVIENFTPSNDKANITVHLMSWVTFFGKFPVVPAPKRARIDSAKEVFTVSGTPQECVNQVFTTAFTETGDYAFPQCVTLPTGGSGAYSYDFSLSEVKTIQEFIDDMSSSYEGYEVVAEVEYVAGSTDTITVIPKVGNPHYRKDEAPLVLNIDQKGDGQTAFSYTENGTDAFNWLFLRSDASDDNNSDWIDLQSVVKPRPAGDEEYMTIAHKEFLNGILTQPELDAQGVSRLSQADVAMKTFTISVFDQDFDYVYSLGRRLQVTGAKRFPDLNEMLRIVGVSVGSVGDPSSVQITVQPAALRVFPRIPNRLKDVFKDSANNANKEAKWKEPKPEKPTTPGIGPIKDWDIPGSNMPKTDNTVMKSPLTRVNSLSNEQANTLSNKDGELGKNNFTEPIWGRDKFWGGTDNLQQYSGGNMLTDSSTTVPNQLQQRFYGLAWSSQMTKNPDEDRDVPLPVELFKTRKFVAFPTWKPTDVGNPIPFTDENYGLSGQGGLVGTITPEQLAGQMLSDSGVGVLKFERLASGMFFRGVGAEQKVVIYFHQLQLFDNGDTQIRSKGFAFEASINPEDGNLSSGFSVTAYPFEVAGSDRTYYPESNQVDVYGPDNTVVSCLTPAGYWRDNDVPVAYPIVRTNTYWRQIQQGRYAIEDATITRNYRTGKVYKTEGPYINVFQTNKDVGSEKWVEKYQMISYGGELWATNETCVSYYSQKKSKNGESQLFMRFFMKGVPDKDGKVNKWEMVAGIYGYPRGSGGWYDQSKNEIVTISSLVGVGSYVFSGGAGPDYDIPEGYYSNVIAGKVGALEGRVMYGTIPDLVSFTFIESDNSSGATNPPKEFFPDFYDFNLGEISEGGQATWGRVSPSGAVIPIWNGNANNYLYNEVIHGYSSMKGLNVDNWVVVPPVTNSYLMGTGSGGRSVWTWYGL